VCIQFAVLSYTRVPRHLAQISGKYLSHISLPGCRRRIASRVDTYEITVSPRPKSSVRRHADRKPRSMANFVPTTVLIYSIKFFDLYRYHRSLYSLITIITFNNYFSYIAEYEIQTWHSFERRWLFSRSAEDRVLHQKSTMEVLAVHWCSCFRARQ